MVKKYLESKHKEYPSLYKNFKPGERVVRRYKKESGETEEYEGIIMAMDPDNMEIYWDTIDGEYSPDQIMDDFTLCDAEEVYFLNQSPIEKHDGLPIAITKELNKPKLPKCPACDDGELNQVAYNTFICNNPECESEFEAEDLGLKAEDFP